MMILPHVAGDNTVMLKKPLCSPVSVVKNLKLGPVKSTEIHSCLKNFWKLFVLKKGRGEKKEKERKTTGQEPKFWDQMWKSNLVVLSDNGELPRAGVGWGSQRWFLLLALLRLTDSHLPHPAALLYSALHNAVLREGRVGFSFRNHRPACLRSTASGYHVAAAWWVWSPYSFLHSACPVLQLRHQKLLLPTCRHGRGN